VRTYIYISKLNAEVTLAQRLDDRVSGVDIKPTPTHHMGLEHHLAATGGAFFSFRYAIGPSVVFFISNSVIRRCVSCGFM